MPVSAIVTGIVTLFQNLPEIIKVIKMIGEAAQSGVRFVTVRIQLSKFDAAAEKAQNEKDTSGLEDLFRKPSAPPRIPAP